SDSKGMKIASNGFRVKNTKGNFLFGSKNGSCSTDSKIFTVAGNEGAVFKTSLQTPRVQGFDVHEFRIESRTRSIKSSAGNLLRAEARDGDVTVTSINDITLTSSKGKFRFESSTVFFPYLFTAENLSSNSPSGPTTPATGLTFS
ncbi:Gamma-sarcoglycan, partial [Armadillidium nasatum]